jgi:hypothetical protein
MRGGDDGELRAEPKQQRSRQPARSCATPIRR